MKKNWMLRIGILICLALMVVTTGCGSREEVCLGDSMVVSLGSAMGTSGGGIDPVEKFAGTRQVAGRTVDYSVDSICYTPQRAVVENLEIPMRNMKNQKLTFNGSMYFMLNAKETSVLIEGFKSYRKVIRSFYRDSMLRILTPLDMGLDSDVYANNSEVALKVISAERNFDDRGLISRRIFDDFMENFSREYGQYMNCFIFLGNTLNNVDFDKRVLAALEKAVGKQYKNESLKVEKAISDLNGQIRVAESSADLAAYSEEAGALSPKIMSYLGNGLMDDIINNPFIDVEIIVGLSKDGSIACFKEAFTE